MSGADQTAVVLAIDSGTSSCKVVAADATGSVLCETAVAHALLQPSPGRAEQDANDWWNALVEGVNHIAEPIRGRVAAITVASQREGIVPVDDSGRPLANCMIWLDRRAESQLSLIAAAIPEAELYGITGLRLDATFTLPRILWLREHAPKLTDGAASLLQPADFLLARLTGRFVSDRSLASRTALLDVSARAWSRRLLDLFEIDDRLLPELVEPSENLGQIDAGAAAMLGVPRTAVILAGAGDQQAMAVGAGASDPGTVAASLGTSTSVVALTDRPLLDPQMRVLCNCSALPGGWDLQAPVWTTGAVIEWLKRLSGRDEQALVEAALSVKPGAEGLVALPHFAGAGAPHWRPEARGALFGLELGHGPAHVMRAMLEAIAYELRENVRTVSELTGPVRQVALTGALASNRGLAGLLAAIVGMPVAVVDTTSAAALGIYGTAAVRLGYADTVAAALAPAHESAWVLEPDDALVETYAPLGELRRERIAEQLRIE